MKLKINKEFIDKYTGELYHVGQEKDFVEARAKELLDDNRNLVTKIEKPEPKTKKVVKKK